MSTDARALQLFQQLSAAEIPVGLYLIATDGRFLASNELCRKILVVPAQGPLPASIVPFHPKPEEFNNLLQLAQAAQRPGRFVMSAPLHLSVPGHDIYVREFIRALHDPDTAQVVGFVGTLIDITQEQRFRQLIDVLPIGIYRVDENDRITHANPAAAKILGYKTESEIEKRNVREFYAHLEDTETLTELVKNREVVTNEIRELVHKSGEVFFASLSSVAVTGADGSYEGREGTIEDVTAEARYLRSLNDVHIGFYEVRREKGVDRIRRCNRQFALMHDYETEEQVIGRDIRQFHASEEEYQRFLEKLLVNDALGFPTLGYAVNIRTSKGQERVFEINSRTVKDRNGKIIGRTGVVRDISNEKKLREDMQNLQSDIGRVLHSYTATLLMAKHALAATAVSLGPEAFGEMKALTADELDSALTEPAQRLAAALGRFLQACESDKHGREIPAAQWDVLTSLQRQLQTYGDTIPVSEFRPPTLRLMARRLQETFNLVPKGRLPRESARQVLQEAQNLERLVCLGALRQAENSIVAMDHQVRALRDFILTGARPQEARSIVKLWDLIKQAMSNLDEYAHSKGVAFKPRDDTADAYVRVSERDVLRALSNLLHNAIKYSWSKEKGKPAWVIIHASVRAERAYVMFENYGVPIQSDEIQNGLIYQFGYRGILSSDRGRLGTGIGLTDALKTARLHGGDIAAESTCARHGAPFADYTAPFITKVTLSLPVYPHTGVQHEKKTNHSLD